MLDQENLICEDCHLKLSRCFKYEGLSLCEVHYLKRLNHLNCPYCNSTNKVYEFRGTHYCRFHYSLLTETHCAGCHQSILKQFVEHKDFANQIWHPECYMIYKFWNVKLIPPPQHDVIKLQKDTSKKVKRIWSDLSSFEESSANCISDMLLFVASNNYSDGVKMANQFILHLQVLFQSLSKIQEQFDMINQQGDLDCQPQVKLICNELIKFFELLTTKHSISLTQELLSIITTLAQNLKYLIRIGLSNSLILEQKFNIQNAIYNFLDHLILELDKKRVWLNGRYWFNTTIKDNFVSANFLNTCHACHQLIEQDCYQTSSDLLKWHVHCFQCSKCSIQLDLNNYGLSSALYCKSCYPNDHQSLLISYVNYFDFNLNQLKFNIEMLSKKLLVPTIKVKRQSSLLRSLGNKVQQQQQKNNVYNPIHIGQMAHTSSTAIKAFSLKTLKRTFSQKDKRLSIKTLFDTQSKPTPKTTYIATLNSSQDFVLKHGAIVHLQPLLSTTIDDLIQMTTKKSNNTSLLWGKLIHHLKQTNNNNQFITFGAPLDTVAKRDIPYAQYTLREHSPALDACFSDNALVPIFIKCCISMILKSDMSIEGVFRKNGNIRQLKNTAESINRLEPATIENVEQLLINQNGIQLAALLKRYLRELPEPLFTFPLYKLFVQCGRVMDTQKQKKVLHLACCLLPKANRDTMLIIFGCLKWVASFSQTNKMDIPNIARVIAPAVLFPSNVTVDLRKGAQEEINVIETLIRDIDEISQVPSDLTLFNLYDIHQDINDLNSKYFINQYQEYLKTQDNSLSPSPSSKHHFKLFRNSTTKKLQSIF